MKTLFALLALFSLSQAAEFHVSPGGAGDYSPGSPGSLYGVRDRVRAVTGAMTEDVVVYLHGGTYFLDSAFILRTEDGGKNGFNVVYRNFDADTPVISGGLDLSGGWTLHDTAKGIYEKQGVDWRFRQLFVNDKWAVRARSPNQVSGIMGNAYLSFSSFPPSLDTAVVGTWANGGACEFTWICHWSQNRARISGYTVNGSLATLAYQAPENTYAWINHHGPGTFGYFENAYALLDANGEWFLDTAALNLYYKPRPDEAMATAAIIAPAIDNTVLILGDSANPVDHIQFRGISFMHGNWTGPCGYGYVDVQGGHTIETPGGFMPLPGLITIRYGRNLRVERCVFANSGAWGVMEHAGSSGNVYTGNRFMKLASGAITLGNAPALAPFAAAPQGSAVFDTVSNNYIEETGYYYNDAVAILALRTRCATIEHNEIANVPYTAINIGFNWTDAATIDSGNRVRFNKITGAMRLLDDGAGIYSLERLDDGLFEGNYVRNITRSSYSGGYPMAGIYLDNGSCYKTVTGNVLENLPAAFYGTNPPNHDNLFMYNYLNCPLGSVATGNTVDSNTSVTGAVWPDEAKAIMADAGLQPAYADLRPIIPPRTLSLLLRLAFDENAGMTAFDSSGNGYDGVLTAGSWTTGRIGNGLLLDGTHGVSMAGPTGAMTCFTVAFWINPDSLIDWNQAVGSGWGQFTFHSTANGAIYCGTDIGTRFSPSELPAGTLELDTWQHFAFTFDSGYAVLYKNGVKLAEKMQTFPQDWTGFGVSSVDGIIDEMRVYDGALDSAFVAVLAQGRDSLFTGLPAQSPVLPPRLEAANPFNQVASIFYRVPEGNIPINLAIYTVDGRLITRLVSGKMPKGEYRARWNAANRPTGLYFLRLEAGGKKLSKKLVLMR